MLWAPLLKGQFPMALLRRRKNIRIKTAKNHPQESCLRGIKIFLTVARRASNPIKIFPFFLNCFHQPAFVSEFSEKQYCKFLSMLDIFRNSRIEDAILLIYSLKSKCPTSAAFHPSALDGAVFRAPNGYSRISRKTVPRSKVAWL